MRLPEKTFQEMQSVSRSNEGKKFSFNVDIWGSNQFQHLQQTVLRIESALLFNVWAMLWYHTKQQ